LQAEGAQVHQAAAGQPWWQHSLGWLTAAAALGFIVPALFSTGLRWPRATFLVPYAGLAGTLLLVSFQRHPLSAQQWVGRWPLALAGAAVASAVLVRNVIGQPASAVLEGGALVMAIAWLGVVYGVVDALLLNVLPVLVVQGPAFVHERAVPWHERAGRGALALAASLAVTAAYHLGFTEFQGPALKSALIGNAIITATGLLAGSPLAAVAAHAVMHVAAVLHGAETTLQLPPHYGV
jgi:hypothetical protein